jgi:hypothetical protein
MTQQYSTGDRILYRGEVGEITTVGIYQRETPDEHYEYGIELASGAEVPRIKADDIKPYQSNLF